jgi:hypothetical protein
MKSILILTDFSEAAFRAAEYTVESILIFAGDHKASLIITVPKKHSFFSAIFHKSISKNLAYNSSIPLLSLPAIR